MPYAGDITCLECWSDLASEPDAQLIDVRTAAEWAFVGTPDLSSVGKRLVMAEWQRYPTMQIAEDFVERVSGQLQEAGAGSDAKLFLLCRSGVRSIAAAETLTVAGYGHAYNVLGGFEGGPNENGRRGLISGWKFDGLPWRQN